MNIYVEITSPLGHNKEVREVNNQSELDALVLEMKSFPKDRRNQTTITLTGIDGDGNPYFNQIR